MERPSLDDRASEIVRGDRPGGASTSQTIMVASLQMLLSQIPADAPTRVYRSAVVQENVLGKQTMGARRYAYRQLKLCYRLDPQSLLFRALRDLWVDDTAGQPLLTLLCALARDPVMRAGARVVLDAPASATITSGDFEPLIEDCFPGAYADSTRRTTARKLASSWAQSGHLHAVGPTHKVRGRATCTAAPLAYALMLGYLQGARGELLFETLWAQVLESPTSAPAGYGCRGVRARHAGAPPLRGAGGRGLPGAPPAICLGAACLGAGRGGGLSMGSYVDDLLAAYSRYVSLPWQHNLSAPERVWMAVYPPEHERRLRLHLPEFAVATVAAGHHWGLVNLTTSFEVWMAGHDYRDEYFESPRFLQSSLGAFFDHLVATLQGSLAEHPPDGVVGLLGAGTLFGLGDSVRVSALVRAVNESIMGRLLVLFPGQLEGNGYRLLDARDGADYLAVPITPTGRR